MSNGVAFISQAQPGARRVGPVSPSIEQSKAASSSYDFFQPDLFRFISRTGSQAQRWLDEYRAIGADELERECSRALILLRQNQLVEGWLLLQQVEAGIRDTCRGSSSSVGHLLKRWYSSVLAFFHYRGEDYDKAVAALEQAEVAVRAAVESEYFLVPFAHHCADFRFQRARVCRNRRQWQAMHGHIQWVREMMENRLPLCTLSDGRAIDVSTLQSFYKDLPLSGEERAAMSSLLDDEVRVPLFDRAVARFYATLGGVVQYP